LIERALAVQVREAMLRSVLHAEKTRTPEVIEHTDGLTRDAVGPCLTAMAMPSNTGSFQSIAQSLEAFNALPSWEGRNCHPEIKDTSVSK